MNNFLNIALDYQKAGIVVIPVNKDKTPNCKWKLYCEGQTEADIKNLFKQDCHSIAMLTGVNGVEVIDIDSKYQNEMTGDIFKQFKQVLGLSNIDVYDFCLQQTPTKGFHLIYKCSEIKGNQKLSSRPGTKVELDNYNANVKKFNTENPNKKQRRSIDDPNKLPKVLFETRGSGGYVLISPSEGYKIQDIPISSVPEISPETRKILLDAAKSFNLIKEEKNQSKIDRQVVKQSASQDGLTCWDDYNQKIDFIGFIEQHGWQVVRTIKERTYLTRPDKKISDGISGDYHSGLNLFKTFSTSTIFEAGQGYSPYAAYTLLEHGGDFSESAKTLYRDGYGDRRIIEKSNILDIDNPVTAEQLAAAQEAKKSIIDLVELTKFDITKPIERNSAFLYYHTLGKKYRLGGKGMIGGITGSRGSGKTALLTTIVSSALAGGEQRLNYTCNVREGNILDIDTEQPKEFFQSSRRRAYRMANIRDNHPNYSGYSLREFTPQERLKIVEHYFYELNPTLAILDGITDFMTDYNDLKQAQYVMGKFMKWSSDTGALILTVIHTIGGGKERGHMGTELGNKSDFLLNVTKDRSENMFHVKGTKERYAPFPSSTFERDQYGIPFSSEMDIQNDFYDLELVEQEAWKPKEGTGIITGGKQEQLHTPSTKEDDIYKKSNNELLITKRVDPSETEIPF